MRKVFLSFLLAFITLSSFAQLSRNQYQRIDDAIGEKSFFHGHLTGFVLYDLDSQQVLFEKNSQIRFLPASSTKLFTLFASAVVLGDSTQTLRYTSSGDTLRIWGTGDPSWDYLEFENPNLSALIEAHETVIFSDQNMDSPPFGYGWQWDDYYYDYAAERTPLPLKGNLLEVQRINGRAVVSPSRFQKDVSTTSRDIRELERNFHSNTFYYNPARFRAREKYIPLLTSPELFVELASDETGRNWIYSKDSLPENHQILTGVPLYPILQEMMLESDNFLAEQLMLMVSDQLFQRLDTERAIEFILKTYLDDLPDAPKWVDASGLSRHNLFTPRSMIAVFEKLYRMIPDDELFGLLPTGGVSGTLETNYQAKDPYIFAKTGTMSNNHSLVGLIKCKSGKLYSFAFMNSNYPYKASEVRREMEKVLVLIRDML